MSTDRYSLRLGDGVVALALAGVALAGGVWLYGSSRGPAAEARVYVAGALARRMVLAGAGVVTQAAPGGRLILETRRGGIRVREADCPEQRCRRRGWIGRPGETIACLPRQVVVELVGDGKGGDCDALTE